MSNQRPNVLFIYPDQLRYDCMGHNGNSVIKTPGFDRMASEGVAFTNAYTSFPLCCPFRASVLTGKYAHANGMYANHYPIPLEQEFLPQLLKDSGYDTAWIGKWHLSGGDKAEYVEDDYRLGFDSFVGFTRGHQYIRSVFYRENDRTSRRSSQYEPDYQTGHLLEFLDRNAETDKPFFAGICYGLPHPPLQAPDWFLNLYKPEDIQLNDTVDPEEAEKAREFMAKYYGLVSCVDTQISRVLNELDRRGLSDNTMVILVSDHGEMGGEHHLYGKRSYYQSSMQVPMIIKYPNKVTGNRKIDALCDPSVDVFATILDTCGLDVPDYAHGESLLGQLEGTQEATRDHVYYQLIKQQQPGFEAKAVPERGLRTTDTLYVERDEKPWALFDLKHDPDEANNLIGNPDYADLQAQFHTQLVAEMAAVGDDWDIGFNQGIEGFRTHENSKDFVRTLWENSVMEP